MIALEGLTKSYRTKSGRHYVFRDLSLTLPEDKSIGIIGRNGAGKSTLLRIIGGIDKPDSGKIITAKSISWPVGLSGGFQGSMTGRENVKFVTRLYAHEADIPAKLAYVESFAEIGKYFDMPVKTYSSGMRSRLAFGLSMAFDFDYYLIDEITAVGDATFQQKSAEVMKQKRAKANFLLVSHATAIIKKFCDLVLHLGRTGAHLYENVDEALKAYQKDEATHAS
ncbi:MAG: ABC transporter ATP-binding protein [Sulfurifustaceae bacterium]